MRHALSIFLLRTFSEILSRRRIRITKLTCYTSLYTSTAPVCKGKATLLQPPICDFFFAISCTTCSPVLVQMIVHHAPATPGPVIVCGRCRLLFR